MTTPDRLDWEADPTATPHENVLAMIDHAPDDWGLHEYKAYAHRYIPGAGPAIVERITDAYTMADFM